MVLAEHYLDDQAFCLVLLVLILKPHCSISSIQSIEHQIYYEYQQLKENYIYFFFFFFYKQFSNSRGNCCKNLEKNKSSLLNFQMCAVSDTSSGCALT